MAASTNNIPNRYHTVTPYLTVERADKLIEFMAQVFGAKETERVMRPNGTIGHADVRMGDAVIMLAEATDEWPPMPAALYVYVDDTDATYQHALQAGATSLMEP